MARGCGPKILEQPHNQIAQLYHLPPSLPPSLTSPHLTSPSLPSPPLLSAGLIERHEESWAKHHQD
jgi:hypothetical protein